MAKQVFLVTGANKGIGYAIVKGLAEKMRSGALIYLTARNSTLGEASLKKLNSELGGKDHSEVVYHQLDITDEGSCQGLASHLNEKHGGIDVLINNAGIAFKQAATETPDVQAEETLRINYYGTKQACKYLVPLIRQGGRIVNVCSSMGVMGKDHYAEAMINKFKSTDYTEEDVDQFAERYKKSTKEGTRKEDGYPESAYRVSKAAEIAYTMLQHRQLEGRNITVNACCPGYVATDMTSHKGTLTVEQGADTPIYLAIDPSAPKGKFVKNRQPVEWLL